MHHSTLVALFESSVSRYPNNVLLREKRGDKYGETTYAEVRERVVEFACGLMSLGVKSGDRVAMIVEGRNDWVIAELGILSAGAVNVPLSVKLQAGPDLAFRLNHSGAGITVVSAQQIPKIRLLRKDLPLLGCIVVLDAIDTREEGEIPVDELYARGRVFLESHREDFEARRSTIRGEDPANICYTSGTTADPKGVVLSHRNYVANVQQSSAMFTIPATYISLLILPWDHCFAHTAGIYTLMRNGASMASVQTGRTPMETLKNIPVNIKETAPSFLLSVPSLAKNFRKNIESGVRQKGRLAGALFAAGLRVAYAYNGNGATRGRGLRKLFIPFVALFDHLLFKKIRENFGGRLEFFVGGGALLDIELQRFFYAIGIPMYQGYGLTESSPVISANTPTKHKLGSSGTVVPDLELCICDDSGAVVTAGKQGEIQVRGENVMTGYWKNEKATQETIRGGWLHTGDLGYLDADGFLYVLGRTKSLLIAPDGEKYSPEGIEETLCNQSPYIDQVMLYNDQSPFTISLLVPNKEAVMRWMNAHKHATDTEEGQRAVLRMLQAEIDAYRENRRHGGVFPERWLPSAVAVLAEGFTEQNGQLNSTLKMVRTRITENHRDRIEYLFTAEGKDICNARNRATIQSWNGRE
ncbi:MAG: AMP-binding protein [Bacteroidota bacterium]